LAAQPAGHRVTWAEFREAFRAHFIHDGIMLMKLEEFLGLKQGDQSVMQYVGRFNHLAQYDLTMSIQIVKRKPVL
jgi:hypothetical protein